MQAMAMGHARAKFEQLTDHQAILTWHVALVSDPFALGTSCAIIITAVSQHPESRT
jgi:hypothetical protein